VGFLNLVKLHKLNIYVNNYSTPDGTGVRDYIHVVDLADGHNTALTYLMKNSGWDAINLGTGLGHSVLEIIAAFQEASGQSIPFEVVARRQGDIATSVASVNKAKNLLNWQARYTLQEMCASSWLWQMNGD
jgi:UDP-glucose 4-epimerase